MGDSRCTVFSHVTWLDDDMSMQELVEWFLADGATAHRGGALCVTTTGYLGCDIMFQVSSDEVFWVSGIQRQKRLVVTDARRKYLSIPTTYSLKMHAYVIDATGKPQQYRRQSMTVKSICDEIGRGAPIQQVMFENDREVKFTVGVSQGDSARLGLLYIVDTYDEKYLHAYPINDCCVLVQAVPVPVYMPITVAVADRFTYSDNATEFETWLDEVGSIVRTLPRRQLEICQDIFLIEQKPSGGHYEYIKPSNALYEVAGGPSSVGGCGGSHDATRSRSDRPRNEFGGDELDVERLALPPLPRLVAAPPPRPPRQRSPADTWTLPRPKPPPDPDCTAPSTLPRRQLSCVLTKSPWQLTASSGRPRDICRQEDEVGSSPSQSAPELPVRIVNRDRGSRQSVLRPAPPLPPSPSPPPPAQELLINNISNNNNNDTIELLTSLHTSPSSSSSSSLSYPSPPSDAQSQATASATSSIEPDPQQDNVGQAAGGSGNTMVADNASCTNSRRSLGQKSCTSAMVRLPEIPQHSPAVDVATAASRKSPAGVYEKLRADADFVAGGGGKFVVEKGGRGEHQYARINRNQVSSE